MVADHECHSANICEPEDFQGSLIENKDGDLERLGVYNILLKWLIFDIIREIFTRDGVICISQEVIFFFDDSGVLHKNEPSGYFTYAGYVFTDRSTLESAKRKYIHANKALKKALGRTDELKAANLEAKHKRSLFNAVKEFDSVAVAVDISRGMITYWQIRNLYDAFTRTGQDKLNYTGVYGRTVLHQYLNPLFFRRVRFDEKSMISP